MHCHVEQEPLAHGSSLIPVGRRRVVSLPQVAGDAPAFRRGEDSDWTDVAITGKGCRMGVGDPTRRDRTTRVGRERAGWHYRR